MLFTSLALAIASASPSEPRANTGTGFFYNRNGDFFTSRHVVSKCKHGSIVAKAPNGSWYPVRLLAVDEKSDIAAGTINIQVDAFASVRTYGKTGFVSVPEDNEDVFIAGFTNPQKNNLKIQIKWGQIQSWENPNSPPYIQRVRLDVYQGALGSGLPILDYAGLLVGILFEESKPLAKNVNQFKSIDYGSQWIFFYNNNAIIEFANKNNLSYAAWGEWERKDPTFIAGHAQRITIPISCEL